MEDSVHKCGARGRQGFRLQEKAMQFNLKICAAAAILLGMAGAASAQPVSGSFQATCRKIQNYGSALTADCRDPSGNYHTSSIGINNCRGDIGNNNGQLNCNMR